MLTLKFGGLFMPTNSQVELKCVELMSRTLTDCGSGRTIATLDESGWEIDGHTCTTIDCEGLADIRFENRETGDIEGAGQSRNVAFHGWYLYAKDKLLAQFDSDNDHWRCRRTGRMWPTIVLTSL